jgi:arylsulfatase A-like enzyme
MAKENRKFTHFCVTAGVCTPSRASLVTGCCAQRLGMHNNPRDGLVLRPVDRDELTKRYTGRALDFIERKKDQPFFLYIPHTIPADSVCDELATAMDILLTFVHMAGGRDPQDRIIDGYDIRPVILGDPGATSP